MTESLPLILQLHTPEQLRFYSNIAHWVEGLLLLAIAIIAFFQALGYLRTKRLLYLWPTIVLVVGIFLPLFAYAHHWNQLSFAWQATVNDTQQLQHMIMAILMTVAGIAEIRYLKGKNKNSSLRLVFPFMVIIIGLMFIAHPQHGIGESVIRAKIVHNYIGIMLISSGFFKVLEIFGRSTLRWLVFPWIIFLAAAAILLISYREPEGAYRMGMNTTHQIEQI